MDRSEQHNEDAGFEDGVVAAYPQLLRLAYRLCRDQADAHDLAQAAVERALRYRATFRTGDAPDRWMSTILRRIFVDDCRGRRRRAAIFLFDEHEAVATAESEPPHAWEEFTLEDVQRALLFVDRPSREVFALFVFGNMAQEEIARRMSISRKTVATRIFRTRAKLRKLLESGGHKRQLALVPPPVDPSGGPTPPAAGAAAAGRPGPHAPRTRIAAIRRRGRITSAGIG